VKSFSENALFAADSASTRGKFSAGRTVMLVLQTGLKGRSAGDSRSEDGGRRENGVNPDGET